MVIPIAVVGCSHFELCDPAQWPLGGSWGPGLANPAGLTKAVVKRKDKHD